MKKALLLVVLCLAPLQAADPTTPVIWTAKQLSELEAKAHLAVANCPEYAIAIVEDGA